MLVLFIEQLRLATPLFLLVAFGYALIRGGGLRPSVSEGMNAFVFNVAMPALLFHMMSDLSSLPPVDARLLIAFFGGSVLTFLLGYLVVAGAIFKLDSTARSIFAMGGVFSNNVLLGIPLAKAALGNAALPSVALILVFNSLTLWTLLSVSIEWAHHGGLNIAGFRNTALAILKNPIVMAILSGVIVGLSGIELPSMIRLVVKDMADPAGPLSLIVLGMGLAEYNIRAAWQQSLAICFMKLIAQPAIVWGLAWALGLPTLETRVVVLLASLATGVNVYLMARSYARIEGVVAASLVASTVISAVTTPFILSLLFILTE